MRMAFPDEFAGMPYAAEEMPIEHERLPVAEIKPDYEASKAKPLARVRDEFDPEAPVLKANPDIDIMAEAAEPEPEDPDGPSLASLEKFAKIKTDLQGLGIAEEAIWTGIHRFTADAFKKAVVEVSDFTTAELELVNGYLHRRKKATEADRAKKAQANG
jgi:hypothetical protein